jgi:TolB protein
VSLKTTPRLKTRGTTVQNPSTSKPMPKSQIARPALFLLLITASAALVTYSQAPSNGTPSSFSLIVPGEKHLGNVRQLTFGGTNAEAYFSADDKYLIFMHSGEGVPCDQMYIMSVDLPLGKPIRTLVSTGKGRTTCGYFFPKGDRILFSSTHETSTECPPRPDYSHGYVWPIYNSYEIYTAKPDGSDLRRLTNSPNSYNAESTISRDGKRIVFTSTRNGDLDIYSMNADGSDVRQLTHELGYDGGAFFSYDGKKIVYRSQQPKAPEEIADYKDLLSRNLIRPGNLEIWVMDADGSHKRQVTHNGAANFAPYFFPDGKRIIFASNVANQKDPSGFDLYAINVDGTGLEQITYHPDFDAFPMFSSDGKRLVWASNRNGKAPHETNIFIADWVE